MCEIKYHRKLAVFVLRKNIGSCQSTHLNVVFIQSFSFIDDGKTIISGRLYFTDVITVNMQPQNAMEMNTFALIKMSCK